MEPRESTIERDEREPTPPLASGIKEETSDESIACAYGTSLPGYPAK